MKAALYARVSTAGQEDEETIDNQLTELRTRIKEDGHSLSPAHEYKDDGWTGTMLERPALDVLRSDAKEGKFEILYFYDRGRLARKFVYQEVVIDEIRALGIECISLHDINGTSPEEQLMGSVMGVFHEYERVKIAERMRIGKLHKVRENKKLLGYNAAYGYDYHHLIKKGPNARDGFFTINEKEAEVVRMVFEWVASGVSLRDVIRRLYELGIPPKKQKQDHWTKGPIVRMLQNSTYTGKHYYNKTEAVITQNPQNPEQKYRRIKKGSRRIRPKSEWMLIEVPRIVDDEVFRKANQRLELNVKFARRNNKNHTYLLTGLIDCECGKPRTGDPANNGTYYYRCTDRLSRFPLKRVCFSGGVNSDLLDTLVWGRLHSFLSEPEVIQAQAERWQKTRLSSPAIRKREAAKKRLSETNREEHRYAKAYGQGYMTEKIFKEHMEDLMKRREKLEIDIAQSRDEIAQTPKLSSAQLAVGITKLLENLDLTDKKAIIRILLKKVKATQKETTIWGQLPIKIEQVGLNAEYRHRRPTKCR